MRILFCLLSLLALSVNASADDKAELQGLYASLSMLNQEQHSLFQQFQMLQELRRDNDRTVYASQLRSPRFAAEVPNYADIIEAQRSAVRRGEELAQQSAQLYAQYNEIEAREAQLRQRILDLTLSK